MNYNYFPIVFLLACPQLIAMEQCAVLPQNLVLHTVPSLKELALKAYAQYLHKSVPVEGLSEKQRVEWAETHGLKSFFDLSNDSLSLRLKEILGEPNANIIPRSTHTKFRIPDVFSPDGCYQFINDRKKKCQYIVRTHERSIRAYKNKHLKFESRSDSGYSPLFSPDGQWLVGHEDNDTVALIRCVLDSDAPIHHIVLKNVDYAFFDVDTILLSTGNTLLMSRIIDCVSQGKDSLKVVYQRNDGEEYDYPSFHKILYVLSSEYIACVGPHNKSIEILKRGANGLFSLTKTLEIPDISIGKLVVHGARALGALRRDFADESVSLYQLVGDCAGKKSTVRVDCLEDYLFSQNGQYLACGTSQDRQVVEVFNCADCASPQHIFTIPTTVAVGPASCVVWTERELVVSDGWGTVHTITFNAASPLVVAYAAHREKQKEAKTTNKNLS